MVCGVFGVEVLCSG
ncbi:hypothetical protein P7248_23700 [Vibrio parahaemolyticus]|nr:hypothetical protein [Vibrio parahaemolyticus]